MRKLAILALWFVSVAADADGYGACPAGALNVEKQMELFMLSQNLQEALAETESHLAAIVPSAALSSHRGSDLQAALRRLKDVSQSVADLVLLNDDATGVASSPSTWMEDLKGSPSAVTNPSEEPASVPCILVHMPRNYALIKLPPATQIPLLYVLQGDCWKGLEDESIITRAAGEDGRTTYFTGRGPHQIDIHLKDGSNWVHIDAFSLEGGVEQTHTHYVYGEMHEEYKAGSGLSFDAARSYRIPGFHWAPIPEWALFGRYEQRHFSQNNEDGVLEQLFEMVGTASKFFVEVGVEDGTECNTRHLRENLGWRGLMLDNHAPNPTINLVQAVVTPDNINSLFREHNVPENFDFLSIDVDGNDFFLWQALDPAWKPKVVVVEYNSFVPPELDLLMPMLTAPNSDPLSANFGASILSMVELGRRKGYKLAYAESLGVNLFFVRDDLARLVPSVHLDDPVKTHEILRWRPAKNKLDLTHPDWISSSTVL